MRIEVINTGSELLLGNVINSHLAFFGKELFPLGLRVARQECIPDGDVIGEALAGTFSKADVVLVTGGLGPTSDDVTRDLAAKLLHRGMQEDAAVLAAIEERFARRGYAINDRIRRQAMVPSGAAVLHNHNGTAPGLYFPADPGIPSPHIFLLPGPPRELHPMFRDSVLPVLRSLVESAGNGSGHIARTLHLAGIGESMVEEKIGSQLEAMPGLELGYCARPGEVDVRLIGTPPVVDNAAALVRQVFGNSIYAEDGALMEERIVGLLSASGSTLATVESCTGGHLADRITNVPGASGVFAGGFLTYSNEMKSALVNVPAGLIEAHGAVSEQVAGAMAAGALERTNADFALSTTGIAGPGGGTDEKPVGTVFVGLARRGESPAVTRHLFLTDRISFKHLVSQTAFDRLRRVLEQITS